MPRGRVAAARSLWDLDEITALDDPAFDCIIFGCRRVGENRVAMRRPTGDHLIDLCREHTDPRHRIVDTDVMSCPRCSYTVGHHPDCPLVTDGAPAPGPGPFDIEEAARHPHP